METSSSIHRPMWLRIIFDSSGALVLFLSLALIAWISYDTFLNKPFLSNYAYMTFQFWVCVIFLIDFFVGLAIADNKRQFIRKNWCFFLISIPYLNIIHLFDLHFSPTVLYYIRYIPLLRGVWALAMVTGYVSKNKAVSMLWQYMAILATSLYILALLFYYEEFHINPGVHDFWDALYFSAMNMTTVGCSFSAITPIGKIISVVLPVLGMLMLPLFTVYITNRISAINKQMGKDN